MKRSELLELSVKDLRTLAADFKIPGRSKLKKDELVAALADLSPRQPAPLDPPVNIHSGSSSSSNMSSAQVAAPVHQGPDPGLPIPDRYGQDRLVLMAQDPHHLFAYWELSGPALERARSTLAEPGTLVLVLRSATGVEQREVDLLGGNYYLTVAPQQTYHGELALRGSDGRLVPVVAARPVQTPAAGPSDRIDEEWMAVDETFEELLVAAGLPGAGGSSASMTEQRMRTRLWSEAAAPPPGPLGSSDLLGKLPSSHTLSSSSLSSWALGLR